MDPFVPPFRFTQFFSPEDTLLCVCASEHAMTRRKSSSEARVLELTTGSGLVGLEILLKHPSASLLGLDVDNTAVTTATTNAALLGVQERATFECADIWSDATSAVARSHHPHLLICNPPYVPEPPGNKLQIEAGAGADGTAHVMRTLEIAREIEPDAIALSWCSLSDPEKILQQAADSGYALDSLFVVAIADGEYSGSVHGYLKTLPRAYLSEQRETLEAVAPDSSATFAYLLMAGAFTRSNSKSSSTAHDVAAMCSNFSSTGIAALASARMSIPIRCWLLDRWDELCLRVLLH